MPIPATRYKPGRRLFGLFLGPSGHGKSTAAVSFPGPILVYDFDQRIEGGIFGAESTYDPKVREKIFIEPFPPSRPMEEFYKSLEYVEADLQGRDPAYKTIVLDSVTTNSTFFMEDIKEQTGGRIVGGIKQGDKIKYGIRQAGPSDWLLMYTAVRQVFEYLRSFPCNVIISGHLIPKWAKEDPNAEYSQTIQVGEQLALTDKHSVEVLGVFNEVYIFRKKTFGDTVKATVRFKDSEIARTCYPGLPSGEIDITGKSFYNEWLSRVGSKIEGDK